MFKDEKKLSSILLLTRILKKKKNTRSLNVQGHDTTAAGSSFFLCLMGAHPDVQVIADDNNIEITFLNSSFFFFLYNFFSLAPPVL